MLTLGNLFLLMLVGAFATWLWHGHGIRERALLLVRRHCEREQVQLLDDNVALRKIGLVADARGRRRLGRVYGFEFTVTGEQRHRGTIVMFGGLIPTPARRRRPRTRRFPTRLRPRAAR
jgi:hypothetical protein